MGSRARWLGSLQVLVAIGIGIGAVFAWRLGLYANVALATGAGLWLVLAPLIGMPMMARGEPRAARANDADLVAARAMLDQSPTPLVAIDADGRASAINRAARQLFATDEAIPTPLSQAMGDGRATLRHAGRSYRIDRAEARGPGAARTLLSLADIEAAERTAEARATRDLIQVLSHEVMNALAPIVSIADSALAAARAGDDREELAAMLATLARRAEGLQRFTDAYREMARLPPPVPTATSLAALASDLERLFAVRWDDRVTFAADVPTTDEAEIDAEQIGQALWALLQNGAEAALAGGASQPTVRLAISRGPARLTFLVEDNGPGLANADRARIFDAFFTTKPNGSGVGLSLARQIARAHGGDVRLGDGATTGFTLTVPAPGGS